MMFDLTGQKAIVTGGTRGLGRAIAEAYHEQGAEVVIISTTDACHKAAAEIASDGGAPVHGVVCDLSNRDALRIGFQEALNCWAAAWRFCITMPESTATTSPRISRKRIGT